MGGSNNNARKRNVRPTKIGFSDCAISYAQALIDPWSVVNPPCVPDELTLPSWKFGARSRGNFSTGTTGYGYIIANPYAVTNNTPMVSSTNMNFATTVFGAVGETNTVFGYNDSPMVQNDFAAGFNSYRLVGSGLAVRYVGNEMARGGQMILYRQMNNISIPNNTNPTEMLQNKETTTVPVDRDWHYVTWKPADGNDISYSNGVFIYYPLVVFISAAGASQGFEFDTVSWFEVTGTAIPNLTPSEYDPLGLAVIKSAIAVPQPPDAPTSNFERFLQSAGSIAMDSLSFLGRGASMAMQGAAALSNIGLL